MATLQLTSLDCVRKHDMTGADEPQLKVNGAVVWSGVMKKGDTTVLSNAMPFQGSVSVELEELTGNNAKKLGATAVIREDGTPSSPVPFKTSGAHYDLHFTVS